MAPNPDLMALVPVDGPRRLKKWSDGASFVVSAKRGTKVRANHFGFLLKAYTTMLGFNLASEAQQLASADAGPLDEAYVGGGS